MAGIQSVFDLAVSIPPQLVDVGDGMLAGTLSRQKIRLDIACSASQLQRIVQVLTADEGRLETPFAMTTFLTVTHYRAIRTVRKTWQKSRLIASTNHLGRTFLFLVTEFWKPSLSPLQTATVLVAHMSKIIVNPESDTDSTHTYIYARVVSILSNSIKMINAPANNRSMIFLNLLERNPLLPKYITRDSCQIWYGP